MEIDSVMAAAKPAARRMAFEPPPAIDPEDDAEDVDQAILSTEDQVPQPVRLAMVIDRARQGRHRGGNRGPNDTPQSGLGDYMAVRVRAHRSPRVLLRLRAPNDVRSSTIIVRASRSSRHRVALSRSQLAAVAREPPGTRRTSGPGWRNV